jgi:hypothetical protein
MNSRCFQKRKFGIFVGPRPGHSTRRSTASTDPDALSPSIASTDNPDAASPLTHFPTRLPSEKSPFYPSLSLHFASSCKSSHFRYQVSYNLSRALKPALPTANVCGRVTRSHMGQTRAASPFIHPLPGQAPIGGFDSAWGLGNPRLLQMRPSRRAQ